MTADTDAKVYHLPPRPSAADGKGAPADTPGPGPQPSGAGPGPGANAQSAQRARARARIRLNLAAVFAVFAGGNVIETPPASITAVWERHLAAARYYNGWLLRWPRMWWGAVHAWVLAPALRYFEWMTESPPKFVFFGFVTWLTLHLLHMI